MDSPLNDLLDTILPNLIQSRDLRKQQEIIDEYFTHDCKFRHPWMVLNNRQEVKQLYELWFRQNIDLVVEVNRTGTLNLFSIYVKTYYSLKRKQMQRLIQIH
jgi:hypothetical protein